MKKLLLLNKIVFILNNIIALLLLLSYITPFIKPSIFSISPLFSLATPILVFANIIFILYWILQGFKKQFLLSLLVIIIGFFIISSIYKFGSKSEKDDGDLSIMTYNVRKFNMFKWIDDQSISSKIDSFTQHENPDILVLQEYKNDENFKIHYPYFFNPMTKKQKSTGLAIFSKYRIIDSGLVEYYPQFGSAIYADIVRKNDTIRFYNFHLSSLGVIPDQEYFGHSNSEKLFKNLRESFTLQQGQIQILNEHIESCRYKVALIGDMNNSAYSWAYKNLKGDLKDSYLEAGNSFGKTYNFKGFPLRIDYIFIDKRLKVKTHQNYKNRYSDHYPIMATVSF